MTYKGELTKAMTWLGKQPNTIFIGQAVEYPGTFMYDTLKGVPKEKLLEMPVCESFQMQFAMGLARAGYIPICIFPRQNFMLHAIGDIVNTLDKLDIGKVIIRTASGTTKPIYPGIQHCGHYASQVMDMIGLEFDDLIVSNYIVGDYKRAFISKYSNILFEHGDMYND